MALGENDQDTFARLYDGLCRAKLNFARFHKKSYETAEDEAQRIRSATFTAVYVYLRALGYGDLAATD
jgi:hypothetical protein